MPAGRQAIAYEMALEPKRRYFSYNFMIIPFIYFLAKVDAKRDLHKCEPITLCLAVCSQIIFLYCIYFPFCDGGYTIGTQLLRFWQTLIFV